MNAEIDQFILYLATERGLSDNYQLSTRGSLELFAKWAVDEKRAAAEAIETWLPKLVKLDITDERKKLKLSALKGP